MILRIYKGNSPGVIFLITVTIIAIWISAFINPSKVTSLQFDSNPMPLYGLLSAVIGKGSHLGVVIAFLMTGFISFLVVNFNTTSFFINERTYLPALFYILAGGLFPEYQTLNPALPASLFLMLAIIRIMDGYRKSGIANNFFDAGILIGTGSLFYANLIWFGLLIFIGIALIRTSNLSDIALTIFGLLTPYFITFGVYYVIGKDIGALSDLIRDSLFLGTEGYLFSRMTIVGMISGSIILLVSIAYLVTMLNSKKIKSRKTFSLLIWTFLISLAVFFIIPHTSVEMIWITAIPACYFLTHYFVFIKRKVLPEILFSALFLIIVLIQIFYLS